MPLSCSSIFQSTPSARRATTEHGLRVPALKISIHALREEGDHGRCRRHSAKQDFNPRPPRGGRPDPERRKPTCSKFQSTPSARRATWGVNIRFTITKFQSTPSARRATKQRIHNVTESIDFNPRPPRGGRHGHEQHRPRHLTISIHALREEGDEGVLTKVGSWIEFQSTPSARRATALINGVRAEVIISIHALREEGDGVLVADDILHDLFQSTPSARRATSGCSLNTRSSSISIHALREEGDEKRSAAGGRHSGFQSTPSARRATPPRETAP